MVQPILTQTWTELTHSEQMTKAFKPILQAYLDITGLSARSFKAFKKPSDDPSTIQKKAHTFISVGVGPGRWTGARVGISFAKTLSFALNKAPVYPMSSLKILAYSLAHQTQPILVLQNAFKNSLYGAIYKKHSCGLKTVVEPFLAPALNINEQLSPHILSECVCLGDGYPVYESFFSTNLKNRIKVKEGVFPEVKYLAKLLQEEFNPRGFIHWKALQPIYLRSPVPALKA